MLKSVPVNVVKGLAGEPREGIFTVYVSVHDTAVDETDATSRKTPRGPLC